MSDNSFLVGLLINPAMENIRSTGVEEHVDNGFMLYTT